MNRGKDDRWEILAAARKYIASALLPSLSRAQASVFAIAPEDSTVKFNVKASVAIEGKFEKWDDGTQRDDGRLGRQNSGRYREYRKWDEGRQLRGKDFFDVKQDPLITFHSSKIVQTRLGKGFL